MGEISKNGLIPIKIRYQLEEGETAYYKAMARRFGIVTTSKVITKKKGVIGRSILGNIVFGIPGAIIAGVTSGSESQEKLTSKVTMIGQGDLILTNKRFIFYGNTIISIPFDSVLNVVFSVSTTSFYRVTITYEDMLQGEYFELIGLFLGKFEETYKALTAM